MSTQNKQMIINKLMSLALRCNVLINSIQLKDLMSNNILVNASQGSPCTCLMTIKVNVNEEDTLHETNKDTSQWNTNLMHHTLNCSKTLV